MRPVRTASADGPTDDRSVLLYDEFDIWEVKPDGTSPRNLTAGEGRKARITFRYRSLDPEERTVPANKPLLLSATDDRTRATGFYRLRATSRLPPRRRRS